MGGVPVKGTGHCCLVCVVASGRCGMLGVLLTKMVVKGCKRMTPGKLSEQCMGH